MSSCNTIRAQFSDYLDGNLTGVAMQSVAGHLAGCGDCAEEFGQWRSMQQSLANLGPVRPPAELALRIRVALSQELSKTPRNAFAGWKVRWQNTVAPFLLQASAGLASSLVLVGTMAFLIGAFAAPEPASARDEPLGMATSPRFLYSTVEANAGTVSGKGAPVTVTWRLFRGPADVKFANDKPVAEKIEGKMPGIATYAGKAETTATFSEPGDYILWVTLNDMSGDGGRGFQCCWTTAQLRVSVR